MPERAVYACTARQALQRLPQLAGKKVVVYNMAQGPGKQPQQLMELAYLIAAGQHIDLVLSLDGAIAVIDERSQNGGQYRDGYPERDGFTSRMVLIRFRPGRGPLVFIVLQHRIDESHRCPPRCIHPLGLSSGTRARIVPALL